MALISDYLAQQFATFDEEPFNAVDSAALTQLCMVRGRGVIPLLRTRSRQRGLRAALQSAAARRGGAVHFRDLLLAEHFEDMFTGLDPARVKDNLFALAASPRFRTMTVRDYLSLFDEKLETQFAAMTFVQGKEFAYVGFRGTDATLTGWKEDFNMAWAAPVPAQEQALRYLETVAPHLPKRLIIGGHSKGGNLAEYAALKASPAVQQRIECVYVHDGPGFKAGMFSESDYAPLAGKLRKTVPQESIVGILMESRAPLQVTHSVAKGIDQHSVFTWEVNDNLTDFAYLDGLPEATKLMASSLQEWLAQLDDKEKERVVEALFRAIETAGIESALDILTGGTHSLGMLLEAAKNVGEDDRNVLLGAGRSFVGAAARAARDRLSGGKGRG